MSVYTSLAQLVGNTPLVRFGRFTQARALPVQLLGKLECRNPAGSMKDRVALEMLRQAEDQGILRPGGIVIEPTSGNTGIGLAAFGTARGYRVIIVMPDTMSPERRKLISAYGAELVLTPGVRGMEGAVEKARQLATEMPGAWVAGQFDNPANPAAHYKTTGPELWADTGGKLDILVAGVGTGGSITGAGRYLKEKNPAIRLVAVEPAESPLLSQGRTGPHGIQGIGPNFLPKVLDTQLYDRVIPVTLAEAKAAARDMARLEGLLVGISSGAALAAADKLAREPENRGKVLAVLLPDGGERYLSTDLFQD
ncbi:MAG TPA: cysteine synthase A [Candidatus Faecousia faecigallinarum]|nr:cysteine synthase A [Candidatus Faecousia faecigallinarum]